jgi:hypothetical protein
MAFTANRRQVCAEERRDDSGDQQDVQDEESREELGGGELAAEEEECEPCSDERDREHRRVDDPKARPREQVVGKRVSGEAGRDPGDEQRHADDPRQLPRPAERSGEEDAEQMGEDRGHEHEGGPVMGLTHDEPGPNLEGDPHHGVVGGGHGFAAQRWIGPVVGDGLRRGDEEEGEEGSRQHEEDEAVQRDLPEHERPVVGEHLPQVASDERARVQPFVESRDQSSNDHERFQKLGPTGSVKSPLA